MGTPDITHPLLRLVVALLCVLWTVSGWALVATRSFSTRPRRVPVETVVDGWAAVFMGAVFLVLGLIALAMLLQGRIRRRALRLGLVGLWFWLPAILVWLR